MALDDDIIILFDLLTSGPHVGSHDDIAHETGWPRWKVGQVLAAIREPDRSNEWGWTIPHVPRGRGDHTYQVVPTGEVWTFTDDEVLAHRYGALSTLRVLATEGANEAHALRALARQLTGKTRRRLNLTADAYTGASAMAEQAAEILQHDLWNGA
jgi:hypothetical protein